MDLKILVIDDVATVRKVVAKSLKNLGYTQILEASRILEAMQILEKSFHEKKAVDLILCDWNMPEGDGIELLKAIRQHKNDKIRLTKFIMITGAKDKVTEAIDADANNVIHKPFKDDVLARKIELIFS